MDILNQTISYGLMVGPAFITVASLAILIVCLVGLSLEFANRHDPHKHINTPLYQSDPTQDITQRIMYLSTALIACSLIFSLGVTILTSMDKHIKDLDNLEQLNDRINPLHKAQAQLLIQQKPLSPPSLPPMDPPPMDIPDEEYAEMPSKDACEAAGGIHHPMPAPPGSYVEESLCIPRATNENRVGLGFGRTGANVLAVRLYSATGDYSEETFRIPPKGSDTQ